MGSDFSRRIFNKEKNYSGTLLQQGRVLLDSDWNEQFDIYQHRLHVETIDVIGKTGVPHKGESFKIELDGADIKIKAGRIYVDGLLCENHKDTYYTDQYFYQKPDFLSDKVLSIPDGKYIAYLKTWQKEINYLDDAEIQEVALGDADTTVRVQTVWQVKLLKVEDAFDCGAISLLYDAETKPSTGMLSAKTFSDPSLINTCLGIEESGYKRLENQLYRIQIHNIDSEYFFKWSRDNATVESNVLNASGSKIIIESLGKDEYLNFRVGSYVELINQENFQNNTSGLFLKIFEIDSSTNELTLQNGDGTPVVLPNSDFKKIIRWDSDLVKITPEAWVNIEDGIQVKFNSGTFRSDDYWMIPARTNVEDILVKKDVPLPSDGIKYSYCRLATFVVKTNKISEVTDCRPLFPSLTDLYELYINGNGCCTIHVYPHQNWDTILKEKLALLEKQDKLIDAKICFAVGTYELDKPFEIKDKGHLVLMGCGRGSKIYSKVSEAAILFTKCTSVLVRDLYFESTIKGRENYSDNLNGAATFINCGQIDIQNSTFKTGIGSQHASTCITVRNDNPVLPVKVRIQNCELLVGHMQQGILLVNAINSLVENNNISTYNRPKSYSLFELLDTDNIFKKEISNWMFSDVKFESLTPSEKSKRAIGVDMELSSKKILTKDFDLVTKRFPPKSEIKNNKEFEKYKLDAAGHILAKDNIKKFRNVFNALESFNRQEIGIGASGITIGGKVSEEIRIFNNTISNFLEGIHIGLSHENEKKEPYIAENVDIAGNSIRNLLPSYINLNERFGIFVGNTFNLNIHNNKIQLQRLLEYNKNTVGSNNVLIEGIRVWGVLGLRMAISSNTILGLPDKTKIPWTISAGSGYDTAIRVISIEKNKPSGFKWLVHDNNVNSKTTPSILIEPNTIKLNDDSGNISDNI
ncbi:MAG: hypothetical protein KA536_15965 [Saprospiraceae bacterium]|nr:hypothetical protein [Saprospiraceae bacterium]